MTTNTTQTVCGFPHALMRLSVVARAGCLRHNALTRSHFFVARILVQRPVSARRRQTPSCPVACVARARAHSFAHAPAHLICLHIFPHPPIDSQFRGPLRPTLPAHTFAPIPTRLGGISGYPPSARCEANCRLHGRCRSGSHHDGELSLLVRMRALPQHGPRARPHGYRLPGAIAYQLRSGRASAGGRALLRWFFRRPSVLPCLPFRGDPDRPRARVLAPRRGSQCHRCHVRADSAEEVTFSATTRRSGSSHRSRCSGGRGERGSRQQAARQSPKRGQAGRGRPSTGQNRCGVASLPGGA